MRHQAINGWGLCPHANQLAEDVVLVQALAYMYSLAVAYMYLLTVAYMYFLATA